MIRTAFLVVLGLHGLLHLLGFAKAFGLADLPQLTQPISRPWGVAWLAAGALTLATAALLPLAPRWWWAVGAVALVASQAVIASSWSDARFGSLVNLLLLLGVAWGFAHQGPWSLPAEYRRQLALASPARPGEVLTEADLAALPDPVRRYVRAAGVVGQPRVHSLRATWTGRIRAGPDQPWMDFTSDAADLVDFASDDRNPSPDGSTGAPTRWTTPARDHARVGPARVPRRAETWWHPASGAWSYGEFELQSLEYGVRR